MRAPPAPPAPVAALQAEADALWARTGLGPAVRLPWDATREEACWFVEHDRGHDAGRGGPRFRFVHWERGREEPLTDWLAPGEAVAWVLEGMATARARADELAARVADRSVGYSRWNWMAPAIAVMGRVSPAHEAALARCTAGVLARCPLSDDERRATRPDLSPPPP